jgi:hypothetical protein
MAAAANRLATWPIRAMTESWGSPFPKPKKVIKSLSTLLGLY